MIEIQIAEHAHNENIPKAKDLLAWAELALVRCEQVGDICIRVVDEEESRTLNLHYRGKDAATNVLSFPAELVLPEEAELAILGDIVLCAQVIAQQAAEQDKMIAAHWAHMVIHGTLHLCGFDHIEADDAEAMEAKEINLLSELGFGNPYIAHE